MRARVPRSWSSASSARSSVRLLRKSASPIARDGRPRAGSQGRSAGSSGLKVNVLAVSGPPIVFGANESRLTVPRSWSPICVKREPDVLVGAGHVRHAIPPLHLPLVGGRRGDWNSGTVGRRLPLLDARDDADVAVRSVEVSVERSSELLKLAEMAKSKCSFGAASNSTSSPGCAPSAR